MKMDFMRQVGLAGLLCFSSISLSLADPAPDLSQLPEYLSNLGGFLGYNISQPPTTMLSTLLGGGTSAENIQQTALATLLGTFLNKTIVDPNSSSPEIPLNQLINMVFKTTPYNTPQSTSSGSGSGSVTVSTAINQLPYQTNPVSQSILDLLTTPDFSFCQLVTQCSSNNTTTGSLASKCCSTPHTYTAQIGINTLGTLPPPLNVADPLDPSIIKQLNSNTLVGPLLLSTTNPTTNTSSSPSTSNNSWSSMSTLTAVSQAQAAANFIRYASSAVAPPPQTDLSTYQILYNLAMGLPAPPKNTPSTTELAIMQSAKAQQSLATYLANMRTIAAQTSVGVANLNELLTKRLPQNPSGTGAPTSQALNEYVMATRRLYDVTIPAPTGNNPSTQWVDQINAASSATVQKEIAILLSEINYQLYLSRQQQDRMILTNSIMLFQLSRLVTPPPLQPPNQ